MHQKRSNLPLVLLVTTTIVVLSLISAYLVTSSKLAVMTTEVEETIYKTLDEGGGNLEEEVDK